MKAIQARYVKEGNVINFLGKGYVRGIVLKVERVRLRTLLTVEQYDGEHKYWMGWNRKVYLFKASHKKVRKQNALVRESINRTETAA